VNGTQDGESPMIIVVIQHADQGGDIGTRWEGRLEETSTVSTYSFAQAPFVKRRLSQSCNGREIEQHAPQLRITMRGSEEKRALTAAYIKKAAMAVKGIGT
jgi:hypothetical protein